MQSRSFLSLVVLGVVGSTLVGCGSGRDVEVAGSVSAPATAEGEIRLEFYEVVDAGDVAERVHTAKLDAAGAFKETVSIEGEQVRVIAIADRDGNGACTPGEFWGEATASIAEDDTVMPVALVLKDTDCPVTN